MVPISSLVHSRALRPNGTLHLQLPVGLFIRYELETIGQGDTLELGGLPIPEAVPFRRPTRRRHCSTADSQAIFLPAIFTLPEFLAPYSALIYEHELPLCSFICRFLFSVTSHADPGVV